MRDRIVRVRISAEELARIQNLAKSRGVSLSDLVRRAALGVRMPATALDKRDLVELSRTLAALGRVGGLLNQLVRRANAGKLTGHDVELSQTLAEVDGLRERLREIIR